MPRSPRRVEAGTIYHVLNRGNGRRMLFSEDQDFLGFIDLLKDAIQQFDVHLLAFCLMGNHWHLLLRPRTDAALSRFIAWITVTHARRHHKRHPNPGSGHLYQGRFKSFPVESDEHFLVVARYIHANPVRAGLVEGVKQWRWNDLASGLKTAHWPIDRPRDWVRLVDRQLPEHQIRQLQRSLARGTPFGNLQWIHKTARKLGLGSTLREPGRPRKAMKLLSARQRRRRMKPADTPQTGQNSR